MYSMSRAASSSRNRCETSGVTGTGADIGATTLISVSSLSPASTRSSCNRNAPSKGAGGHLYGCPRTPIRIVPPLNLDERHVAHSLGSGDRVVLEASCREARGRGDVVFGAERDDEDVGVVRAAVGRHVPSGGVDRRDPLLAELDARLGERAVRDADVRGVGAIEQDVELREAEGEAVVLVDQRDPNLAGERVSEAGAKAPARRTRLRERRRASSANPTLPVRTTSRDTRARRARGGGSRPTAAVAASGGSTRRASRPRRR